MLLCYSYDLQIDMHQRVLSDVSAKKSERGPLQGVNLGLSMVNNLNLRGYVKFCTRPTTCRKKDNLSKCRQVLDLSICRSVDSSEKIDRSTNNMVIWDTKSHLSICRHVDRLLICRSVDDRSNGRNLEKIDISTDKHQQIVKSWDTLI